jgi:hypothetical protein
MLSSGGRRDGATGCDMGDGDFSGHREFVIPAEAMVSALI